MFQDGCDAPVLRAVTAASRLDYRAVISNTNVHIASRHPSPSAC